MAQVVTTTRPALDVVLPGDFAEVVAEAEEAAPEVGPDVAFAFTPPVTGPLSGTYIISFNALLARVHSMRN